MTDERLSSSTTVFYRWLFAPAWLLGFNGVVLSLVFGATASTGALTTTERIFFLAAAFFGSAFIVAAIAPLRSVSLRGSSLVVARGGLKHSYPLGDLVEVTQVPLMRPASATLVFREDHGAGTRVRLLLPFGLISPVGWPVVGEAPQVTALRARLLSRSGAAAI